MDLPIITKETRKPITAEMRREFEVIWDKFTVDRGYGYFESDLLDLPGKPSSAKHIERLDEMDVFDSDIEAALYGEKFFGEKLFHYDLGSDEEISYYWFVDEPQTRKDVEEYLNRRFGEGHGILPDYETIHNEKELQKPSLDDVIGSSKEKKDSSVVDNVEGIEKDAALYRDETR